MFRIQLLYSHPRAMELISGKILISCTIAITFIALVTLNINWYLNSNNTKVKIFKDIYSTTPSSETSTTWESLDLSLSRYILHSCSYVPFWRHFGYCDDSSNTKDCNFDNGDCCLPTIKTDFCYDCICHLDKLRHQEIFINISKDCDTDLMQNGICEDQNNNYDCGFEFQDCCSQTILCPIGNECICHLDGQVHPSLIDQNCSMHYYEIGDGYCDDWLNNERCNFDGMDCCLPIISTTFCYDCICHLDGLRHYFRSQTCDKSMLG